MKKSIYKVPNGKLLKIFLDDGNGLIKNIKITGDFFVHPEEAIEKLEENLIGKNLEQNILQEVISDFIKHNGLTVFGVDTESLVKTILDAK